MTETLRLVEALIACRWLTPADGGSHAPLAGRLHGRGAADMKTAVAATSVAGEHCVAAHREHAGTGALRGAGGDDPAAGARRRARAGDAAGMATGVPP